MIPKIFVFMALIMVIGVQVESKANPVEKRSENITKWESYTWDRELNQNIPCKVYNGISTERASGEIICCPNSCGGCGGTGCDNRPGGAENCCGDNIVNSGRICGYVGEENGWKRYEPPCYYGICKKEDSKCGIQLLPPKDHGKCCPGFTCGYNGLGAAGRCIKEIGTDLDKAMKMGPPLNEIDFEKGLEIDTSSQDGKNEMKHAIQKGEMGIDTMLNAEQATSIANGTERALVSSRNVISMSKRWPNARVPYQIASSFTQRERADITKAVEEIQSKTCVRIVPKEPTDNDYLEIVKRGGCYSYIGMLGGRQRFSLGNGCVGGGHVGIIIREIMHALGFKNEEQRPDRDSYVKIYWENLSNIGKKLYRKCKGCDTLGLPYDYDSITHAAWWWWSKTGTPGMEALNGAPLDGPYGQLKGLSPLDVKRINKYYGCSNMINCDDNVDMYDSNCADCDTRCSSWRSYCSYHDYVRANCKKTCNLCDGNRDPLPNAPGCYIRFPSGCPNQAQYKDLPNKLTWIGPMDDASNSRQQCDDAWKQPLNDWCGVNDTIVEYVERK